jgi:MarR family transcriptional regulator, lower aerobic nicotinate degradation pathway regulator
MAKSFDLETSPGHLLRRANQFANDLYTNEVEPPGLTQRQFAVLFAVDRREGASQTELVQATGIDRSTLADMIVRMQNRELLARKRTDKDQRANSVRITPSGRRAMRAAMPAVFKSDEGFLAVLPMRMRGEFIKSLALLAQAANDVQLAEDDGKARSKVRKRK